jgi:hypothetical protein
VTYRWKACDENYNFALNLIAIEGLHIKLWGPKIAKVPTLGISGLPLLVVGTSRSSSTPFYPQSVMSQGACPDSLLFHYFHFKLTFESIKEFRNASIGIFQNTWVINWILYKNMEVITKLW